MKASIDIGTNTALLLVAEVENERLTVVHEEQRVPRLGAGVDKSGLLSKDAMDRVIKAVLEYQKIIDDDFSSVDSIKVTATSAVRDAQNKTHFLNTVFEQTGLKVQVLSGSEEAQHTFSGAKSILHDYESEQDVIIDIGGGSTEIASGSHQIRDRYSYNIGCVRFTERFLNDDPPTEIQIAECREAIRRILKDYEFNFVDGATLIGVAGTVTSLAYLDKELNSYDGNALSGHIMSIENIGNYIARFKDWPGQKLLERYPVVMKGRADIFLAGLLILEEFMKKYGFSKVVTSTGGIRHGIMLDSK